jgi:hypothetical protein
VIFEVALDTSAKAWVDARPGSARVITYDVTRCCGGGKLCQVGVRALSRRDDSATFARGRFEDGSEVLIDPRAAARLPARFGLTVRGIGPLKHLDLDLEPEEWGTLLYD